MGTCMAMAVRSCSIMPISMPIPVMPTAVPSMCGLDSVWPLGR